jgi:hypothetical protein
LDDVERDFEHGVGDDGAITAVDLERVGEEVFGELGDLDVGQAGIGFADGEQAVVVFLVSDGEGVVAEDIAAFAVAVFDADHDDVEGGVGLLEFEPGEAAAAGCVEAVGILGDEAFVAALPGGEEGGFDVGGGVGGADGGEGKPSQELRAQS